ncbi:4743_t:CDS:2 [Acaulospora colombiana]|uniref:4743_t:CDS:1 n=1 Tax=Acaulospora colombiana TaxID=27376 RepID=A0ACA9ML52_9GLOM|nr:4743_t:CDS:2 [Acaulospora colombiana]
MPLHLLWPFDGADGNPARASEEGYTLCLAIPSPERHNDSWTKGAARRGRLPEWEQVEVNTAPDASFCQSPEAKTTPPSQTFRLDLSRPPLGLGSSKHPQVCLSVSPPRHPFSSPRVKWIRIRYLDE